MFTKYTLMYITVESRRYIVLHWLAEPTNAAILILAGLHNWQ